MSKTFEQIKLLEQNGQSGRLQLPAKVSPKYLPSSRRQKSGRVQETQNQDWTRAIFILQKHWRLFALFAIGVFLSTAIATFLTKPVYEPAVMLEIDPPGTQAFALERVLLARADDVRRAFTPGLALAAAHAHDRRVAVRVDVDAIVAGAPFNGPPLHAVAHVHVAIGADARIIDVRRGGRFRRRSPLDSARRPVGFSLRAR